MLGEDTACGKDASEPGAVGFSDDPVHLVRAPVNGDMVSRMRTASEMRLPVPWWTRDVRTLLDLGVLIFAGGIDEPGAFRVDHSAQLHDNDDVRPFVLSTAREDTQALGDDVRMRDSNCRKIEKA